MPSTRVTFYAMNYFHTKIFKYDIKHTRKNFKIHTSVVFMDIIDLKTQEKKLGRFHMYLLLRHNYTSINVIFIDMTKVNFHQQMWRIDTKYSVELNLRKFDIGK